MALTGKPSIPTPNRLEARAVQLAISNARQRIEQIEAAINTLQGQTTTLQNTSSNAASAAELASLQSQITALSARVTVLENITLYDLIEEQSPMSGAEATMDVPVGYSGEGWKVSAYDIAALLMTHSPYSSGVGANALVPVRLVDGSIVLVNTDDIGGGGNLQAMIDALSASSNAEADAEIPGTRGGVAYRFNAYDIANLLMTHSPYSSGAPSSNALVPVRLANGLSVLVSVGDIGGNGANLQALIDALSAMSGAEASMMVPATIGGVAYRVNAFDIANLLLTHPSYSSGAEASALVPVRLTSGQTVLISVGDIAALAPGSNLVSLINAFSASSGADPAAMVPGVVSGVTGVQLNAYDIATLLLTHSPYSSGIDIHALVPVMLSSGSIVLVTAGDLAALATPTTAAKVLTDASTVSWDWSASGTFYLTATSGIGATRAMGTPTNAQDGQSRLLWYKQDGSGSRALTWSASVYKQAGGGTIAAASTAASALDLYSVTYNATDNIYVVAQLHSIS